MSEFDRESEELESGLIKAGVEKSEEAGYDTPGTEEEKSKEPEPGLIGAGEEESKEPEPDLIGTGEEKSGEPGLENNGDKLPLDISWDEDVPDELAELIFYHSPDTVKKGEPYDLLILFCAFFASACFLIMLISGINHGFTPSMYILMCCYVLIAFCCLFKPLHVIISKAVWNGSFREKFPVNKGYEHIVYLDEEALWYTDAVGKSGSVRYDDMRGIYESKNYLIFHEDDKRLYAANKSQFATEEEKNKVYALLEKKIGEEAIYMSEKEYEEISAAIEEKDGEGDISIDLSVLDDDRDNNNNEEN